MTNPTDSTYDPKTGKFYGPDGEETVAPPVPPFLRNRGWGWDARTGQFIDPNGGRVDPSEFYPPPETNPNPDGYTYDPETKTFFGPDGPTPYADLPPYLEGRGYRSDPKTGEIFDPEGNLVDPSTIFPPEEGDPALKYDPRTGKYYSAAGQEVPPTPSPEMRAMGWRHDPATGQWIDPKGNRLDPSQVFDPPSDPNPHGLSYDPKTGKYFDEEGSLVPGELPEYMTNQGWSLDPSTGEITDPSGADVDPATMFPEPTANPGGFTYDPGTKRYFGTDTIPELPDYMKERGWEMNFETGQLVDPEGNEHDPSTYFPAPSTDTGFFYDPDTGKFYTPGGSEMPPTLPDTMQGMGWQWDPVQKTFIDPEGNVVAPDTLLPHPHPDPLPSRTPSPTSEDDATSLAEPDPSSTDPLIDVPEGLSLDGHDFWYGAPAGTAPGTTHVVQPGENLFRIALRYGTSVSDLRTANDLTSPTVAAGQELTIPASSGFAAPGDLPLDVSALNTSAAAAGSRDLDVQLEIVFLTRTRVPGGGMNGSLGDTKGNPVGWLPRVAEKLLVPFRSRFARRARVQAIASTMIPGAPAEPLPAPLTPTPPISRASGVAQPPARAPVTALFTSLGVSTGKAFEVELVSDGTQPIDLGATGVVLEPLDEQAQEAMREEFVRAAAGRPTTKTVATGYCLELARQPPAAGMVFRVAPKELQEKFTPMRDLWHTARRLLDAGRLSPDSDPEQYFHSIVQWAVWSKENGFDEQSFGEWFVKRTRENFAAANQPWTDRVREAVEEIVPNRWNDIERILNEAERLRAPARN